MNCSRRIILQTAAAALLFCIIATSQPAAAQGSQPQAAPPPAASQAPVSQPPANQPPVDVPAIPQMPQLPAPQASSQPPQQLTLRQAEMLAVQNHPQVQAAQNVAEAAKQQVREVRSSYYPQANGSLTGADALRDSRIAAGALNNPIIYGRESNGIAIDQLVTDFGRTHELAKSAGQHAQSEQANIASTRAEVLLAVDQAYFGVLRAQAVERVAEQTVQQRQLVARQVTELARNLLKSNLDATFADVDLSQAQLLLLQAQNDLQASFATLSDALGYPDQRAFALTDEPLPAQPPADPAPLVAQAMNLQPQVVQERYNVSSAQSYATAERDLFLPTISGIGAAGVTPLRQDTLTEHYAAAGVNVNIPIFNGFLFNARYDEAKYRATAEQQVLRDLENHVARDVRTAWLSASSAFQRLAVTDQLYAEAAQGVNLAQARYNLGLSSIIELSQAQLNLTQAQIQQATARYDYQGQISLLNYRIGILQ